MRADWRPPVVRLYDAAESGRQFSEWCPEGRAQLLLLHEGPASRVAAEIAAVRELCTAAGGEPSATACVDSWLERPIVDDRPPTCRCA